MRTPWKLLRRVVAPTALVALAACGGGGGSNGSTGPNPQPTPSPNQVTVKATTANAFSPATTTVAPGGKVEFEFESTQHTVTFSAVNGAPADIPATASATVERSFATAGTYNYHCTIHPGMAGSVVVAATTTSTGTGGTGCTSGYTCQ
ncbi:MAG TPA: cupredoxin domain-containing protein [Gemmatimonadaceae bacterium]|nr:cupredoxin domain-containing protein [Gemmatimonadaceae bacterium]